MEPTGDSLPFKERPKNLAEALELWRLMGEDDSAPSPAGVQLAAALAERLDAVVPAPFHVRAENGWVSGFHGAEWDGSSEVAGILDRDLSAAREDGWEPDEWTTTEPWPRLPEGGMANPGSRADSERVYLWYGPDEKNEEGAVLLLPPIDLTALHRAW